MIGQNLFVQNKAIILGNNRTQIDTVNQKKLMKVGVNKKHNPFFILFNGLMFIYQNGISQQLQANCAYYESCSNFSKRCIKDHGLFKGILYSGDRIMRCVPNIEDELDLFEYKNNKIIDSEYK